MFLLCVGMLLSVFFTLAVEVYRDGEYVGTLSDAGQVEDAVSLLESRVSGILGYDYTLDADLTTRLTVVRRGELDSVGSVRAALYREVNEITTGYALIVNGQVVGVAGSPARLQAIMNALEDQYAVLGQLETPVSEAYTITYTTVPADTATDVTDIMAAADNLIDFTTVAQSSYTVEIPYGTEFVLDEELYVGESQVVTEGVAGVRTVSTQIRRLNGEITRDQRGRQRSDHRADY